MNVVNPAKPSALFDARPKANSLLVISCSGALLAIWPLPETIAFRHAFLILGFLASLSYLIPRRSTLFRRFSWPFWLFLGFFTWMLLHLAIFSVQFDLQLSELGSLWARCLLAIPAGLVLGLLLTQNQLMDSSSSNCNMNTPTPNQRWAVLWILLGLSGTALIFFGRYLYEVQVTHQWLHFDFFMTLYKGKPPFVIASALALPLCFILIIRSINQQMSRWWIPLCLCLIGLVLFGDYFANTKNGIAIFAAGLGLFILNLLVKIRWSWRSYVLGFLILAAVMGASYVGIQKHIERNSAWTQMIANFEVGLDIDHQNFWKNRNAYPQPTNALGALVDISTYERTAWFTAGARLLSENPQGFGLIHHSFGWLALAKWSDFYQPIGTLRGATHSGWMDMALGVGIPGLLLVLIPLGVAWFRSLFQQGLWFSYAAWTIPMMCFAYLTTELTGAHSTEILFFMTAFFCGITLRHPVQFSKKIARTH